MERINDKRFGTRFLIRNFLTILPHGIGIMLLWRDWGRFDIQFWLGLACFLGGIAWWARLDRQLLRAYHCPRCDAHLPQPSITQRADGDPICFYCAVCDVEWDTTLRQ